MSIVVSGTSRLVKWNKAAVVNMVMPLLRETKRSGLHISFANNTLMTCMNRQYRQKNRNTDILSFPDDPLMGTIYINPAVVLRKMRSDPQRSIRHFRRLLIHGLVHLLGYDHETDEQWREMRRVERYWWRRLPCYRLVTIHRVSV